MADKNIRVGSSSIGFPGSLTILFIYLKMTGHIAWSWWWVLSPLWIGFVALIVIILLIFVAHAVAHAIAHK